MCGDCVESRVLDLIHPSFDFESPKTKKHFENQTPHSVGLTTDTRFLWQETRNVFFLTAQKNHILERSLQKIKESSNPMGAVINSRGHDLIKIGLCRILEANVENGFESRPFLALEELIGQSEMDAFFTSQLRQVGIQPWRRLFSRKTFIHKEIWDEFLLLARNNVQELEGILDEYIRSTASNPETKSMKSQWNLFEAWFPVLYFGLLFHFQYHPSHSIIQRLAIARPHFCDLAGNDYWIACIFRKIRPGIPKESGHLSERSDEDRGIVS